MADDYSIDIELDIGNGGGAGGTYIIHLVNNALDKTWQEIYDALHKGKICVIYEDLVDVSCTYITSIFSISGTGAHDGFFIDGITTTYGEVSGAEYKATTANDFPTPV